MGWVVERGDEWLGRGLIVAWVLVDVEAWRSDEKLFWDARGLSKVVDVIV